MVLTPHQIEAITRLVRNPSFTGRLDQVRREFARAVERDRAGLDPIETGDPLRDYLTSEYVRRVREAQEGGVE